MKITSLITILLVFVLSSVVNGQEKQDVPQFNGKFAVKTGNADGKNYYLVDFTQLPSRFEKVWFMNETFSSGKVVNTKPDITKETIEFQADNSFTEKTILEEFDQMKKRTTDTAAGMTQEQKQEWLKKNDKYK